MYIIFKTTKEANPPPQPLVMVRLVLCPKCRKVLPEVPNVPVYMCGGCGALLQAKNRKVEAKRRESDLQETNIEVMKESSHEAMASPEYVGLVHNDEVLERCDQSMKMLPQDGYGSGSFTSDEKIKLLRVIDELQDKLDRIIREIPTCYKYKHHCCYCHPMEKMREFPNGSTSSEADKCCSEIQVKKHQKIRSPLHGLMGYSSPTLFITGTGLSSAPTAL